MSNPGSVNRPNDGKGSNGPEQQCIFLSVNEQAAFYDHTVQVACLSLESLHIPYCLGLADPAMSSAEFGISLLQGDSGWRQGMFLHMI